MVLETENEDPPTTKGQERNLPEEDMLAASLYHDAQEEEKLAASVYHDARQSLTPSMMYRPAVTASARISYSLEASPRELLKSHRRKSIRDSIVVRRLLKKKKKPPPQSILPSQPGYPGDLTRGELEACLEFRKDIRNKREQEPSYHEMVHCYTDVEEEAFALCRFMRARKFVVPDALDMMAGNLDTWKEGKAHDFYPNLEAALGCPPSVLLTQLPLLQWGTAENGSVVYYFQAGSVSLEALDCLTDLENFVAFIWHQFMHAFKDNVAKSQRKHPNTAIRSEMTVIIDLRGITRSLFTKQVMEVLKGCIQAFNCFPEILNKLVITNAPFFFSAIWLVFKSFLDARTVSKIDIYSTERKGLQCISEYIAKEELLSDYGGSGPPCREVLQGLPSGKGALRHIVQRFFMDPRGKAQCDFDLTSSEKATVIVYTRSVKGAQFALSKSQETVQEKDVKQDNDKERAETETYQPYSTVVASEVTGPGHVVISAVSKNSSEKEFFLVQVRIEAK